MLEDEWKRNVNDWTKQVDFVKKKNRINISPQQPSEIFNIYAITLIGDWV